MIIVSSGQPPNILGYVFISGFALGYLTLTLMLSLRNYAKLNNMTIKEDSGNLLSHVYKYKVEGIDIFEPDQLLKDTGWDKIRLKNAIQYLIEKEFVRGALIRDLSTIKEKRTAIPEAVIHDITSNGIDIIEDKQKFKTQFGITLNLGLMQINYGKQES